MRHKFLLMALYMCFGLSFGAYGAEGPGSVTIDKLCFTQLAGDVPVDEVKKSGDTVKVPYCPKWCTRTERKCTEWLDDGKCKLYESVTETYCCP